MALCAKFGNCQTLSQMAEVPSLSSRWTSQINSGPSWTSHIHLGWTLCVPLYPQWLGCPSVWNLSNKWNPSELSPPLAVAMSEVNNLGALEAGATKKSAGPSPSPPLPPPPPQSPRDWGKLSQVEILHVHTSQPEFCKKPLAPGPRPWPQTRFSGSRASLFPVRPKVTSLPLPHPQGNIWITFLLFIMNIYTQKKSTGSH